MAVLGVSLAPLSAPVPPGAPGLDKLAHAAIYAALMLLFARAYPARHWRLAAAGLAAYGGLVEVLQHFAPMRHASWADGLANAVGISIMLAFLLHARETRDAPAARRAGGS